MFEIGMKQTISKYKEWFTLGSVKRTVENLMETYTFATNDPSIFALLFVAYRVKYKLQKYLLNGERDD